MVEAMGEAVNGMGRREGSGEGDGDDGGGGE